MSASPLTIIGLVAKREFITRVMAKAFLISTSVILAVTIGGLVIFSVLSGRDDPAKVAIAGGDTEVATTINAAAKALGTDIEITTGTSETKARSLVADGEIDVALIADDDGSFTAVSDDGADAGLQAAIEAGIQQLAINQTLRANDVDPQALSDAVVAHGVEFTALNPPDPDKAQRIGLAYVGVFLLFFAVFLYGTFVAMGVVEEKSSRVVELLLATIKPLHLLIGKIFGVGAVGLVQIVTVGGVGLITAVLTDLVTVGDTAAALFVTVVVWYILGYAFFAVLYAAFASLVSRQEDVNAVTTPLTILAFSTFLAAQSSLENPDATWVRVLAWIPPFSATMMPLRVASGVAAPLEFAGTIVVMIVALAAVAVVGARIYENSVLNVGGRQSLKQAYARRR